jgi:hypothetical protein
MSEVLLLFRLKFNGVNAAPLAKDVTSSNISNVAVAAELIDSSRCAHFVVFGVVNETVLSSPFPIVALFAAQYADPSCTSWCA